MEKWKLLLKEKKFLFLVLIFSLAIIFLLFGEYSLDRTENEEDLPLSSGKASALEERLCETLQKMEGVGDVHVFILTEESIAAGGDSLFSTGAEAKSTSPAIRGVSVVCQGAKNVHIKRKIILLIASTLNLNENQIYVTE